MFQDIKATSNEISCFWIFMRDWQGTRVANVRHSSGICNGLVQLVMRHDIGMQLGQYIHLSVVKTPRREYSAQAQVALPPQNGKVDIALEDDFVDVGMPRCPF